jgi:cephalosporin hydroxylase
MLEKCPVEIYQNLNEFEQLYNFVKSINPTKIVEIGSLFGGTLWYWMNMVKEGSKFLVVDSLVPESDTRYQQQVYGHSNLWYQWANAHKHNLQVIEGHSQDPKVINAIYHNMPQTDFLFIDGDHNYNVVKSDFLAYLDLVRPGGIIAMHDVHNPQWGGAVRLWQEIVQSNLYQCFDFTYPNSNPMGIGAIYVPQRP